MKKLVVSSLKETSKMLFTRVSSSSSMHGLSTRIWTNARWLSSTTNKISAGESTQGTVDGAPGPLDFVKSNRDRILRSNEYTPMEKVALQKIPVENFNSDSLFRSAENLNNVVGFLSMPVSVVGPLMVNGRHYHVPMATGDSKLIAKAARGCKALEAAGGVQARVFRDGVTQSPILVMPSVFDASSFTKFVEDPIRIDDMQHWFAEINGACQLQSVKCQVMGRRVLVRFSASCGDGTGSEAVSKGIERVLAHLAEEWNGNPFQVMKGTVDTVEECGKSVAAEVVLPSDVVESILQTDINTLLTQSVEMQALKGQIVGGLNARRIVSSIFLATGQDLVQRAEASPVCETLFEPVKSCLDPSVTVGIRVSCTMPSIDVGTVGSSNGRFSAQQACLHMLGVSGSNIISPGENAQRLAEIICSTVLASELGSIAKYTASTDDLIQYSQQQFRSATQASSSARSRIPAKRTSVQSPPPPEAARGVSSIKLPQPETNNLINVPANKSHPAYLELVAGKCAAEFGWADPRLTVP